MSSVTLKGIHKTYDPDVHVIKGIDLEVQAGEFVVLVGPSGCGKSTLLRLIAGLEEITQGTLSIGQRIVNDVPPKDRGIGMVFQSYALYPHMSVRENMGFGLKIRKVPAATIRHQVEAVAATLDLSPYLDRMPKQLSGGQRQRVAIGRALVRKPEVFLFDEPLSNLDAALRTQMRVELKKLHHTLSTTMIYVTHDQVEAMTLATRIVLLDQGVIQQVGTPAQVYDTPANLFVAQFMGAPAMNLFAPDDPALTLPDTVAPAHTLGVRAQHLEPLGGDESPAPGSLLLQGVVEVVEPMGWEAHVHLRTPQGKPFAVHLQSSDLVGLAPQAHVRLACQPEHVHRFDAQGNRLTQ